MAQWVKDLALSLQGSRSLLWCRFVPWPGNFHKPPLRQKKRKEGKKERERRKKISRSGCCGTGVTLLGYNLWRRGGISIIYHFAQKCLIRIYQVPRLQN